MIRELAKTILLTQQIREDSYDHEIEKHNKGNVYFNFEKCYKINIYSAAKKALHELNMNSELIDIIYLLCKNNWNDSNEWADRILKQKEK